MQNSQLAEKNQLAGHSSCVPQKYAIFIFLAYCESRLLRNSETKIATIKTGIA